MTKITVRDNGPLLVEGEGVTVCDADGGTYPERGTTIALCRCGASQTKPFCDGNHNAASFQAADRADG